TPTSTKNVEVILGNIHEVTDGQMWVAILVAAPYDQTVIDADFTVTDEVVAPSKAFKPAPSMSGSDRMIAATPDTLTSIRFFSDGVVRKATAKKGLVDRLNAAYDQGRPPISEGAWEEIVTEVRGVTKSKEAPQGYRPDPPDHLKVVETAPVIDEPPQRSPGFLSGMLSMGSSKPN
ncbi:MAG: hypothetical protein AAB758_01470, partial [Patescibacteria group bacterium]